jgi:hypothetical protein
VGRPPELRLRAGAPGGDLLADFIGTKTSNFKNHNISQGDFKKLKCVVGSYFWSKLKFKVTNFKKICLENGL